MTVWFSLVRLIVKLVIFFSFPEFISFEIGRVKTSGVCDGGKRYTRKWA